MEKFNFSMKQYSLYIGRTLISVFFPIPLFLKRFLNHFIWIRNVIFVVLVLEGNVVKQIENK